MGRMGIVVGGDCLREEIGHEVVACCDLHRGRTAVVVAVADVDADAVAWEVSGNIVVAWEVLGSVDNLGCIVASVQVESWVVAGL